LKWSLKQSCSPRQELFNNMSYVTYMQRNWVDSRLLVVESQTANLTIGPSFGHNLCFRCPNGSCEPILDIYIPWAFQWYKELLNPLIFYPCDRPLKIREFTRTPSPKVRVALGMWRFIPSHFPTLPVTCNVTSELPLCLRPCKPLCLGRKPKARVATSTYLI
jgi:hypothetical protein